MKNFILLIVFAVAAGGCAEKSIDDLHNFTKNARVGKKPRVEPLPRIPPHETFVYTASELTDPFSSGNLRRKKAPPTTGGLEPDTTRRKEPLEQFPLDAITMVGTLSRDKTAWAILRAPDGTVHRAQRGNYVGQSFGVITNVTEEKTELKELVRGATNNWVEREATITIIQ